MATKNTSQEAAPPPKGNKVHKTLDSLRKEREEAEAQQKAAVDYYPYLLEINKALVEFRSAIPGQPLQRGMDLPGEGDHERIANVFIRLADALKCISSPEEGIGLDHLRRAWERYYANSMASSLYEMANAGNREGIVEVLRGLGQALAGRQTDFWRMVREITREILPPEEWLACQAAMGDQYQPRQPEQPLDQPAEEPTPPEVSRPAPPHQVTVPTTPDKRPPSTRTKRSTHKGEPRVRIIAALTKHHQYYNGGVGCTEAIVLCELARTASAGKATVHRFFNEKFNGHEAYCAMCVRNVSELVYALKLLNGEVPPKVMYSRNPPGEGDREDDR